MVEKRKFAGNMEMLLNCNHYISNYSLLLWEIYKLRFSLASSVTVHALHDQQRNLPWLRI